MKRAIKILIFLVLGMGIILFTSLPFKIIEGWVRINGFQASGFSGSLFQEIRIENLLDENSKRSFQFSNMVFRYEIYPKFKIKSISADKLTLRRTRTLATEFLPKLPEILNSLKRPIAIGKDTNLTIENIHVGEALVEFMPNTEPLIVKDLLIRGVFINSGNLSIDLISSGDGNLKFQDSGTELTIESHLPKILFSDLKLDLSLAVAFRKERSLSCQSIKFMNAIVITRGQKTQILDQYRFTDLFVDSSAAEKAETIFKDFVL